jgi:hypothetical protein
MTERRDIYSRADLTPKEQEHVRDALRFLRAKVGNWEILAKALRMTAPTLIHVNAERRTVSPTLTFRIARLAKIGIDDLLAGKYPVEGACLNCGKEPTPKISRK